MKLNKRFPEFFITAICALSTFFLSFQPNEVLSDKSQSVAVAPDEIKIATSKNLWCALTLIADKKNFFFDENIRVTLTYQAAGRLNMEALVAESVDVANVVEVNVANQAIAGNPNLSVLGSIVHAKDFSVVVRSQLSITKPEQMNGIRIGFAPGTGSEIFLYEFLKSHGIETTDVTLVKIPPTGIVDQFTRGGEVDAVVSWEPFVSTMVKQSSVAPTVFHDKDEYTGLMSIAVRQDWGKKYSDLVKRIIASYRRTEEFVKKNPKESQEIIHAETGIPLPDVIELWRHFDFSVRITDKEEIELTRKVMSTLLEKNTRETSANLNFINNYYTK